MKPESALQLQAALPSRPGAAGAVSSWTAAGLLVLALCFWLGAWYFDTLRSIVAIWLRSETYAHGFLIAPISAYLIWIKRRRILQLSPSPDFAGLVLLGVLGFGWLSASLANVLGAQQYCVIAMLVGVFWTVLGRQIVRAALFPLLFLLLAVPVGEFLIPPLMNFTADFTVGALKLTGIPVFREGNFFTVPTGSWSVVEACSGLRYLIASVTLGCLYAYLTYRSTARRVLFITAAAIVPIIANGLRAYMIVMIGHLSNMKLATGIDHYLYGWVFFGVVVLLMFWAGSFWREDEQPEAVQPVDAQAPAATPDSAAHQTGKGRLVLAACSVAAMLAIWPAYADFLENRAGDSRHVALLAPQPVAGWAASDAPVTDFTPHFLNAKAEVAQTFAKDRQWVNLYVKYYRNQREGAKLITSQNKLVSTVNRQWGNIGESTVHVDLSGAAIRVHEAKLRSSGQHLLVWYWYWIERRHVANPYLGKLLEAKARLTGKGDDAAVIILAAPYDAVPDQARALLQDFLTAHMERIDTTLAAAGRGG